MSIVNPVLFTPIDDIEVSFTRPVSDELVKKLIQNTNMLGRLACIGTIRTVAVNQPGVPAPNTDQFQECNGTEITHPASTLHSINGFTRLTPDIRNRYPRGAPDEVSNAMNSLTPTNNLTHAHTTGAVSPVMKGYEADECRAYEGPHSHTIGDDLSSADPIDVAHTQIAVYLKIN